MGLQTDLEVITIDTTLVLMSLIKSAVTNSLPDDAIKNVGDDVLKDVFQLAQKHDLAHMIADVLLKNKMSEDKELLGLCSQASFVALLRYQQQTYEFKRICDLFEANAIPYIPLKGAVIRELYPEPWMRSSCDIDILVH